MTDLEKLVNSQIENLRPKLLDLSRRNPLVSTRFSDRSHSHVRIVDELPDVLFEFLSEGRMRFVPLPKLEDDPKDEQTRDFKNAVAEARLTEEEYLATLDKIDQDRDDSAEKYLQADRELKDRTREILGMPLRQTKGALYLAQHARNNHINPSYDLPEPVDEHDDGRHGDKDIQTLLLPDMLERRLNALMTKRRTWIQETGINVLSAAFGFLEYTESKSSKTSLAPLILLPVTVDKKKTTEGPEFRAEGLGESPETNTVLKEKMRLDFGLDLPKIEEGQLPENYFAKIAKLSPAGMTWRVRRQVAIGVFPSARMAMYLDLDTEKTNFGAHQVVGNLFGGSGAGDGSSPFAEEYEVDDPKVETKVAAIVADADPSQFSAIVDVADGQNVAVEGPPGTGKSQTIVNVIASALAEGKKVLFVAEKMAALDVVKARIEACGLGEFLLPLQANRSTKAQVIKSIKERIEMPRARDPSELDSLISRFQDTRSNLAEYINAISSPFRKTGLTVHDILGSSIMYREFLESLPEELLKHKIPNSGEYALHDRSEISQLSDAAEKTWVEAKDHQPHWQGVGIANIDPFLADEITEASAICAETFSATATFREKLHEFGLPQNTETAYLAQLHKTIHSIDDSVESADSGTVKRLAIPSIIDSVEEFFLKAEDVRKFRASMENVFVQPLDPGLPGRIKELSQITSELGLASIAQDDLDTARDDKKKEISALLEAVHFLQQADEAFKGVIKLPISSAIAACNLVYGIPRETLALRSDVLVDPAVKTVFEEGRDKAHDLLTRRESLNDRMSLTSLPEKMEITAHAANMAVAGFFSFLSADYRRAKKFYLSISQNRKFKKSEATHNIQELAEWVNDADTFLSNHQLERLIGLRFNGLDTDFEPFADILEFYSQIDDLFSGPENVGIKEFLRKASVDSLLSLPKVSADHGFAAFEQSKLEDLSQRLTEAKEFIFFLETSFKRIEELAGSLKDREGIYSSRLRSLEEELILFQEQWNDAHEDKKIKNILGAKFRGAETRKEDMSSELAAAKAVAELGPVLGGVLMKSIQARTVSQIKVVVGDIIQADRKADEQLKKLASISKMKEESLLEVLAPNELAEKFKLAASDKEGLLAHSRLASARQDAESKGLGFLFDGMMKMKTGLTGMSEVFKALLAQAMSREAYNEHGKVLSKYNGSTLDALRERLADLDLKIMMVMRERVCAKVQKLTQTEHGIGRGKRSEWTEMALIEHEITKKRAYVPVRDLTRRAGKSLLALKPCWMMSPLAVAQYLKKGDIEFDLVIIDEASQMTPEDAIGALARSHQAMVVGDTNQLPPSSFFRKLLDDDEVDPDEKVTEESILEIANAVFRPKRRLRWHYRSRHGSLIAFSNRHVYDDELVIFPQAEDEGSDMGVSFEKVTGLYSSGTNPKEARAMVDAAVVFMHKNPRRSLGLVTLNQKQRDLVLEEMNYALQQDAVASKYIEEWEVRNDGLESFFIKNLENVQGDERDVIFIGTVYGPEQPGAPVMQRFGPINGIAGKRRLNVLFSRAKEKIVTFSSMTAADIRADDDRNPGVYMLKRWIEYSASGRLETGEITGREPDSDFERHVIEQIEAMGCEAVPQVGVSGYFIDIGVRHPNYFYGFIMGVECDGATYHSSKSARERDRIRQEVLEGRQWYLHRIWSTDWFEDPRREAERLRKVVLDRLSELDVDPHYEELVIEEPGETACVGDKVVVCYADEPDRRLTIVLSDSLNDPSNGIAHIGEPLGEAVLGSAEGEEIEIYLGKTIRTAVVEEIIKDPTITVH